MQEIRQLVVQYMHPKYLSIHDYTYLLPADRIAKYPLAERDLSKLLIYKNNIIEEDIYRNIASHIPNGACMVFNNTRVIAARLLFQKSTGGVIEIFCLEPSHEYADITTAMLQKQKVVWHCMVGGASKWKHGQVLEKKIQTDSSEIILQAKYIKKNETGFDIELSWSPNQLTFAEVLHHTGAIPLPPYIKREAETTDAERYQTVYAEHEGSVAAPTAGLHFTEAILQQLTEKNITTSYVTLHVGAGTFKPVKSDTMQEHDMHAEFIDVSKKTIEELLTNAGKTIIAVGTTSLRTIESLYWLGVKLITENKIADLQQWEAYELEQKNIPVKESLQVLLEWMKNNHTERVMAKTSLLVAPSYRPKLVKALVTNFHQPESTLLLLVAALIGNDWRNVYDYAFKNNFRFLSYGDGSLLWVNENLAASKPIKTAYLLLGSNMLEKEHNINTARQFINDEAGKIQKVSALYETAAWGKEDQPAFLNQAIEIETSLSPKELLNTLLLIEKKLGRIRQEKYGPRIIDIDILLYENNIINEPYLTIPHPELQNRRFALAPLADIADETIHPVFQKNIKNLLTECPDELEVRKLKG